MEQLRAELHALNEKVNIILERQEQIRIKVDKTEKMVTGNGKIEEGIAFRVKRVEDHVDFVHRFGWIIVGALATIPSGVITGIVIYIFKMNGRV